MMSSHTAVAGGKSRDFVALFSNCTGVMPVEPS